MRQERWEWVGDGGTQERQMPGQQVHLGNSSTPRPLFKFWRPILSEPRKGRKTGGGAPGTSAPAVCSTTQGSLKAALFGEAPPPTAAWSGKTRTSSSPASPGGRRPGPLGSPSASPWGPCRTAAARCAALLLPLCWAEASRALTGRAWHPRPEAGGSRAACPAGKARRRSVQKEPPAPRGGARPCPRVPLILGLPIPGYSLLSAWVHTLG